MVDSRENTPVNTEATTPIIPSAASLVNQMGDKPGTPHW